MKKIIRLTESDLARFVKQVIKEYSPYDRSIDDLEGSFQKKYDDKYLRYRNDDVEITRHNPESEADSVLRRDHEDKIDKLKTYYKEKIIYDFFQNINLTPEENDKLEFLDEKLSNPNLGPDKIERYKSNKRQIYLSHLNEYLNSLDNRYFGQYFISNNYDYFKDKIRDFAYNDNLPSEPVAPSETVAPTSSNLMQRAANKFKGYFGLSENKRLSERDLTRIVKRVIKESVTIEPYSLKASNGNLQITDTKTKKSYTYKLEKKTLLANIDLTVNSIDNNGLSVSVMGMTKTAPLDKEKIKSIIKNNWGAKQMEHKTKDGDTILFTRV